MPRKIFFAIIGAAALAAVYQGVQTYAEGRVRAAEPRVPTIESLPKDAVFIEHDDHTEEAEGGRTPLRHYATPEDLERGGPIYGTFGYRIVAVEYEIPVSTIGERPVGEKGSGSRLILNVPERPELKHLRYDHFHIGRTHIKVNGNEEEAYSIHFMLIPHEKEESYGLACG